MVLHFKQLDAKPIGMHSDAGKGGEPGLYLQVSERGRSWVFRYQLHGRRREMGLGPLAEVGLAEARARAREARALLKEGRDPIAERDRQRQAQRLADAARVTFADCALAYVEAHEAAWRNPKHRAQWRATLGLPPPPVPKGAPRKRRKGPRPSCRPVCAIIGNRPVAEVDTDAVMACLRPLHKAGLHETLDRVRGRIEKILDWAKVSGYRSGENPARWRGHIDKLLPPREKVARVKHRAAVPWQEVPALMRQLAGLNRQSVSSMALRFTILCASRPGEVVGATWPEFDLDGKLWTIPGARMKSGREHRVPLSDAALAIVREMQKVRLSPYVFPGARGRALSDMALLQCLRGLRPGFTVHGTARSSFRDWVAEATAYSGEVAEMCLAHVVANRTEAAYRRGDLLEKRRQLMQAWGDYCTGTAP